MKRYLIIAFILCLSAQLLTAQDSTRVQGPTVHNLFRCPQECGCSYRPVNDYSGLNSLRMRLANPTWDGSLPSIGTGLKLENGKIGPLAGSNGNTDTEESVTFSETSVQGSQEQRNPYLARVESGGTPLGPPVFVFFSLAGSRFTDPSQALNVNAVADLAIAQNLNVRITGAADSATGSAEKNAALALARAEYVSSLMKGRGVDEGRIEVRSEGGIAAYEPVAANRDCRIELFVR